MSPVNRDKLRVNIVKRVMSPVNRDKFRVNLMQGL